MSPYFSLDSRIEKGNSRFFCSLFASAMLQCAAVILFLMIHTTIRESAPPIAAAAIHRFQVVRLVYPINVISQIPSNKIGSITGRTALRTAISRPSMPRATTPQQLTDLVAPGEWPNANVVQRSHIPTAEPRAPINTGLLTSVTYQAGQLLKARQVQVGGFNDPVRLSDRDPVGLTNKRHHGIEVTEFGNGFGNGGGQVFLPALILWKPTPSYTAEARLKQIEGEVIVDVMFQADRRVEVLGFVQRLGYGLDEVAVEAVRHIRFRPASVNGKAIDLQARAHIEFHPLSWLEDWAEGEGPTVYR